MIDFTSIDYLKVGSDIQRKAYWSLTDHSILNDLEKFDPILVGTIPIGIDIEGSDLDIICCWKEKTDFIEALENCFGDYPNFELTETNYNNEATVICRFGLEDFIVEIFGQTTPTKEQFAYRHMIIEYKVLERMGEPFRQQIIELKKSGLKTEPAFAQLLKLNGDPYVELLKYELT
jgi:hypothetical protein